MGNDIFDARDGPRREWSRRESNDIDKARGVRFRGRNRIHRSECLRSSRRGSCAVESHKLSPAGMEPTGVERHRQSPKGEVSGGETESIEASVCDLPEESHARLNHTNYPRRESNPHLRFRKPLFYPLNYGDGM